MNDIFSRGKRSQIMSNIRAKGNRSTELRMLELLNRHHITGWRRHLDLPGKPDFAFRSGKLAVFVDGCFWHGCPRCFRAPKKNAYFWKTKISGNIKRDKQVSRSLRNMGWSVIRVRECSLRKNPEREARRIQMKLG